MFYDWTFATFSEPPEPRYVENEAKNLVDNPPLCLILQAERGPDNPMVRTLFLVGFLLPLFASSVVSQPSNIYTFSGDVDLGVDYAAFISSGQHYIGAKGDTVYVVTSDGGNVYCQKSTDGGQSFGLPAVVNSVPPATNPSMRVDTGGIIYVAYQHDADIYFSKSTDGGASFTLGVKVNDDTIPQTGQEKPSIAVNNKGQVFICWRDQRNSAPQTHQTVFAAASYDGGYTFIPNVQINDSTTPMGGGIDIGADDSGRVYIVWEPYSGPLQLSKSSDSGETYPYRIVAGNQYTFTPSMAVGNGVIGVVWENLEIINDTLQFTLYFSHSTDFGQSFSPSMRVDDDEDLTDETEPLTPSLTYKKGVFYAVWRDAGSNARTSFTYSPNNGQSFLPTRRVSSFSSSQLFPSLTVNDSGKAFVAWLDNRIDPIFSSNRHTFVARGIPQVVKGDLNLDGIITMVDVVIELNAVFVGQSFPAPFETADGNCDGRLSPADMVLLLNRYYLSIPFPCS